MPRALSRREFPGLSVNTLSRAAGDTGAPEGPLLSVPPTPGRQVSTPRASAVTPTLASPPPVPAGRMPSGPPPWPPQFEFKDLLFYARSEQLCPPLTKHLRDCSPTAGHGAASESGIPFLRPTRAPGHLRYLPCAHRATPQDAWSHPAAACAF